MPKLIILNNSGPEDQSHRQIYLNSFPRHSSQIFRKTYWLMIGLCLVCNLLVFWTEFYLQRLLQRPPQVRQSRYSAAPPPPPPTLQRSTFSSPSQQSVSRVSVERVSFDYTKFGQKTLKINVLSSRDSTHHSFTRVLTDPRSFVKVDSLLDRTFIFLAFFEQR